MSGIDERLLSVDRQLSKQVETIEAKDAEIDRPRGEIADKEVLKKLVPDLQKQIGELKHFLNNCQAELAAARKELEEAREWKRECLAVVESEMRTVDICHACQEICGENQTGGCMAIQCFDRYITAKAQEVKE